jgi:hypothetical protein
MVPAPPNESGWRFDVAVSLKSRLTDDDDLSMYDAVPRCLQGSLVAVK